MDFTPLKEYLDYLTTEVGIPGADLMVYKNHEPIFRYFTGFSDKENQKPMNGDELYFIFSMTKMLTCTGMLQLLEKGKYLINDPLSKYFPEFGKMRVTRTQLDTAKAVEIASGKSAGEQIDNSVDGYAQRPILIRDLFTMCAGLDYDLQAEGIKKSLAEGKTSTRELVKAISETVLGFEPGTRYRYSLCHDVLGGLIEVLSGQTFGEYMKENIFDPIGMKNTFFGKSKDPEKLAKMAALYRFDENGVAQKEPLECAYILSEEYESGGAGLTSCTEDYALFLDALANGGVAKNGNRILSPSSIKLMGTNHLEGVPQEDFYMMRKGYGYGLGVRVHTLPQNSGSLSPVGEFGWDGAAAAFSMVDPVNNISLTYFQHVLGSDFRMHSEMRNILYGCLKD